MQVQVKSVNRMKVLTGYVARAGFPVQVLVVPGLLAGLTVIPLSGAQDAAGESREPVPAEQTAAAYADPDWRMPRFSWGDPNLEGTFTSRDMSGIPMVRPEQYGLRRHLTVEEFRQRVAAGGGGFSVMAREALPQQVENRLQLAGLDATETGTRIFGYTSYIIDPDDGQMPAFTEAGQQRQAARQFGQSNGPFYTMDDFSFYDRCITRGVTGSILPSLYGDAMRIVQSPTEVAISYEMLHDTRIIPLDGRPPADPDVRQYLGSSTGHWEDDTLVVETTNLTDKLRVGRMAHSKELKLTERFTRIDPEMIDYVVRVDDPRTFERPWTFRLTLTTQPGYEVLEYSCHEGNVSVTNALMSERAYQRRVAEARAKGEPIPGRNIPSGILDIYKPPPADDAVDINAEE
jgi:hypothetical protein